MNISRSTRIQRVYGVP